MITDNDLNLIIDLLKLMKKYGPESFTRVAKFTSSEEMAHQLSSLLNNTVKTSQVIKSESRNQSIIVNNPVPQTLVLIKSEYPLKYEVLFEFYREIQLKKVLPTLKSIKSFSVDNNLHIINEKTRDKAIDTLINELIVLTDDRIKEILLTVDNYTIERPKRKGISDSKNGRVNEDRSFEKLTDLVLNKKYNEQP